MTFDASSYGTTFHLSSPIWRCLVPSLYSTAIPSYSHETKSDASSHDATIDASSHDATFDAYSHNMTFDASSRDTTFDTSSHDTTFDASSHDTIFDASSHDTIFEVSSHDTTFRLSPPSWNRLVPSLHRLPSKSPLPTSPLTATSATAPTYGQEMMWYLTYNWKRAIFAAMRNFAVFITSSPIIKWKLPRSQVLCWQIL